MPPVHGLHNHPHHHHHHHMAPQRTFTPPPGALTTPGGPHGAGHPSAWTPNPYGATGAYTPGTIAPSSMGYATTPSYMAMGDTPMGLPNGPGGGGYSAAHHRRVGSGDGGASAGFAAMRSPGGVGASGLLASPPYSGGGSVAPGMPPVGSLSSWGDAGGAAGGQGGQGQGQQQRGGSFVASAGEIGEAQMEDAWEEAPAGEDDRE